MRKLEAMDEFERELEQAFARRPAPPSLKRRLMERRGIQGPRPIQAQRPVFNWQRLAASLLLSAILAGGVEWRIAQQRRREEATREQVFTALRITSQALERMNTRLAARHRGAQD